MDGKRRTTRRSSADPEPEEISKKARGTPIAISKNPSEDLKEPFVPLDDDVMLHYLELPPVESLEAHRADAPEPLGDRERRELELALEFEPNEEWLTDWSGVIGLMDREVSNPLRKGKKSSFQQSLVMWATTANTGSKVATRRLYDLLRLVYHMPETPSSAKALLMIADPTDAVSLEQAMRRTSYDPVVLRQDGWTTKRSQTKEQSATGGPYYIGAKIRWQDSDAVVISYVHDEDIGDLWKAYWIVEQHTFDLEAEEVLGAKRKWERRSQRSTGGLATSSSAEGRKSSRFAGSTDFTVPGIEHGIVLATSFAKGSRPGVYWPARVVHASETHTGLVSTITATSKRSSAKQKVDLVFLAPYWNSELRPRSNSLSEQGSSLFSSGPLFDLENVDATDDMIKEYAFGSSDGQLDLDELRMSFRFTGLPRPAFRRFLDSHRMAMALKTFAKQNLKSAVAPTNAAAAGLLETHIMSMQTPLFPQVILHLPFEFILDQLRNEKDTDFTGASTVQEKEPIVQLSSIIGAMKRPQCWGLKESSESNGSSRLPRVMSPQKFTPILPASQRLETAETVRTNGHILDKVNSFFEALIVDLEVLQKALNRSSANVTSLRSRIGEILTPLFEKPDKVSSTESQDKDLSDRRRKSLIRSWIAMKRYGADVLCLNSTEPKVVLLEWNIASERIYRRILAGDTSETIEGNGKSYVLSDYRCNGHRTSDGCFERAVRLPAAIKGAKMAGAGQSPQLGLITEVNEDCIKRVKRVVIPQAHSKAYLDRMKNRCAAAKTNEESLVLTDDSKGNGGQDTRGSKGTWDAAVAAVAIAVSGVEKIVNGDCMNVFCVTRPPGHHAGRSLHCMKAVSNGFCILNTVACAALYAVTPVTDGGLGLSRVCVIDFDVHHGNGTQDILCSTYDPRFLYVSLHAGGAHVNGVSMEDDPNHELHDLASKSGGIYPGRCGDTSPHAGVLNIPLGAKVMSHEVGLALVHRVTPRVNAFVPDLIILSAGFDAHKSDPMGLGALSAADFGHITEVACQLAFKNCSGRVLSVMEGGYGVPCCRTQCEDRSHPVGARETDNETVDAKCVEISDSSKREDPLAGIIESASGQNSGASPSVATAVTSAEIAVQPPRPQPSKLLDLGDDIPDDMDDQVPLGLQRRLEKCHAEGFVQCVCEHVRSLARYNRID